MRAVLILLSLLAVYAQNPSSTVPSPTDDGCGNSFDTIYCRYTPDGESQPICVETICSLCVQVGGEVNATECIPTAQSTFVQSTFTQTDQCSDTCQNGECMHWLDCANSSGVSVGPCADDSDCICCVGVPETCDATICSQELGACYPGEAGICESIGASGFGVDGCGDECQCCVDWRECSDRECDGDCSTESECTQLGQGCMWNSTGCGSADSDCGCCTCESGCGETSACNLLGYSRLGVGTCVPPEVDCGDLCSDEGMSFVALGMTACDGDCQCCVCSDQEITIEEAAAAVCGDSILDSSEECEDGNTVDGDGCSSDCRTESCPQILLQASADPKNCAAPPFTTTDASTVACINVGSESVHVDCAGQVATMYSATDCSGDVVESMSLATDACLLSAGMYAAGGSVVFFPAATCYGACAEFDPAVEIDTELGTGGIMPNTHTSSTTGEIIGISILVIALPLAVVICAFLFYRNMQPDVFSEPVSGSVKSKNGYETLDMMMTQDQVDDYLNDQKFG